MTDDKTRRTDSGIEVDPVYTASGSTRAPARDERPGEFPYTRGVYDDMYRGRVPLYG